MLENDSGNDISIDMGAAQAAMDHDFGSGAESVDKGNPSPAAAAPVAAPTPSATPMPQEWETLPKAWKKEMEGEWKTMSPGQKQYIYAREKQALDGITQYSERAKAADKWDQTLLPFKQYMDKNQIDPFDAVKRLGAAEMVLRYGSNEEKGKYLVEMFKHYGLQPILQELAGKPELFAGLQAAATAQDPRVGDLTKQVETLTGFVQQQREAQATSEIEAFLSDKSNVYAEELIPDMTRMIGEGRARDLKSAYEQAMWLNPDIRQKILDAKVKEATTPANPAPRLVRSSTVKPVPTEQARGSLEDTLRETYKGIIARSA